MTLTAVPVQAQRESGRPRTGEVDPDTLRRRMGAHETVMETLHEDVVLKSPDSEQFAYENTVESGEMMDGVEWERIRKVGTWTYVPTVNKEVEDGYLRIFMLEETVVTVHTTGDGESRTYSNVSESVKNSIGLECIPACPPGCYCVGGLGGGVGGALAEGVCLPLSTTHKNFNKRLY